MTIKPLPRRMTRSQLQTTTKTDKVMKDKKDSNMVESFNLKQPLNFLRRPHRNDVKLSHP